jgi:hypothetical protein
MPDFKATGTIQKVDEAQGLIFGWASVCVTKSGETVVDSQGDLIDIADLEEAAYEYVLESRDGGEMHVQKGVSRLVETMVFTPEKIEKLGLPPDALPCGWWVGFQIDDPDVLAKAKSGEYSMFSIGGSGVREVVEDAN